MTVYTFIEPITRSTYSNGQHSWNILNELDGELNDFLQDNKDKDLEITSQVQVIKNHNNGGYNTLVKITTVIVR